MYLCERYKKPYRISQLLEAIDANILPLYAKYHWGYSLKSFVAALNDCHPNYVGYLVDKKTLSFKSVNEILSQMDGDKKLLYDKSYIEKCYLKYQQTDCDDKAVYDSLCQLIKNKKILIIGPGKTIIDECEAILKYIDENAPFVVAINYIPKNINIDALFLTNAKRYNQHASAIAALVPKLRLIATSNLTRTYGDFDFTLDYEALVDRGAVFMDNSFVMMLRVLTKIGATSVAMAGFDGYGIDRENYYTSDMEYDFTRKLGAEINLYVNRILSNFSTLMDMNFITTTTYELP
jgi:4-hydroxy 2-oxovalerate aldolase